jgi:hypothetical protein
MHTFELLSSSNNRVFYCESIICSSFMTWGQFHQRSTSSFCMRRSWKRKKSWQLDCLFCSFSICESIKAAHRTLMKLPPVVLYLDVGRYKLPFQRDRLQMHIHHWTLFNVVDIFWQLQFVLFFQIWASNVQQ